MTEQDAINEAVRKHIEKIDREILACIGLTPEMLEGSTERTAETIELQAVDFGFYLPEGDHVKTPPFGGCTTMIEDDMDDEFDGETAVEQLPLSMNTFIDKLQDFLNSLPEVKRGNVFQSVAGDGYVALNLLVGMPFEGSDSQIRQVNLIVLPTDREMLNSTGTSLSDPVDEAMGKLDTMKKEELRQACRDTGVAYGKLNNDGMRQALRDAFDEARKALQDGI